MTHPIGVARESRSGIHKMDGMLAIMYTRPHHLIIIIITVHLIYKLVSRHPKTTTHGLMIHVATKYPQRTTNIDISRQPCDGLPWLFCFCCFNPFNGAWYSSKCSLLLCILLHTYASTWTWGSWVSHDAFHLLGSNQSGTALLPCILQKCVLAH